MRAAHAISMMKSFCIVDAPYCAFARGKKKFPKIFENRAGKRSKSRNSRESLLHVRQAFARDALAAG